MYVKEINQIKSILWFFGSIHPFE